MEEVTDYNYCGAPEVVPLDEIYPRGFVDDLVETLSDFLELFIANTIHSVFFWT